MRRIVLLVVAVLIAPALASAQTTLAAPQAPAWGSPLMPAPTSSEPSKFISGYAKDVRGEVVRHESPHPDANSALIARATDAAHNTIEWESAPVPADARGPVALALVWNVSVANGARWTVYAGDTKIATLTSPADPEPRDWEVTSEQAPDLRVEAHLFSRDRHSDPGGHLSSLAPAVTLHTWPARARADRRRVGCAKGGRLADGVPLRRASACERAGQPSLVRAAPARRLASRSAPGSKCASMSRTTALTHR